MDFGTTYYTNEYQYITENNTAPQMNSQYEQFVIFAPMEEFYDNHNTGHQTNSALSSFIINPEDLSRYGYPTECTRNPYHTYIFKDVPGFEYRKVHQNPSRKECVRCKGKFDVNMHSDSFENCYFHFGKIRGQLENGEFIYKFTCCNREKFSKGCSVNKYHVWSGVAVGLNGPYYDFAKTFPASTRYMYNTYNSPNIYALDCEMCYTEDGLECTMVTVIDVNGQLVYETLVRPDKAIVDYNTKFSGITKESLSDENVKTLKEVQQDLLQFITEDSILIGHGLENDLRALKIIHKRIIDTAILYQHQSGIPFRHSLKNLTKIHLKREIQTSDIGHSSLEDCRAALDLVLLAANIATNNKVVYL